MESSREGRDKADSMGVPAAPVSVAPQRQNSESSVLLPVLTDD